MYLLCKKSHGETATFIVTMLIKCIVYSYICQIEKYFGRINILSVKPTPVYTYFNEKIIVLHHFNI